MSDREFARFLLAAPTIYLALPMPLAQRAIACRWAEPHYLQKFGLMPAGTILLYTPKNRDELRVCYSLFFEAYHSACKLGRFCGSHATPGPIFRLPLVLFVIQFGPLADAGH